MAFEWVKESAEKAKKAITDVGTSIATEVQSLEQKLLGDSNPEAKPAEKSEKDSAGDAKKSETAVEAKATEQSTAAKSGHLNVDQKSLQAAALKAEAKDKGLLSTVLPKFDGSVLDTVTHVVSSTAETLSSASAVGTVLGFMSNPLAVSIGAGVTLGSKLFKVRGKENEFVSEDRSLRITKLVGAAADKIKEGYNKLFDDSTASLEMSDPFKKEAGVTRVSSVDDTSSLPKDMMHWLFDENEKPRNVAISDNLFSSTNDKKEKTDILAVPGQVHIEKRDADGTLRTIVDKTSGRTMVLHDKETVTIENGKQVVKGDGYTVTWDEQGKRHITLTGSNKEVIRDKDGVKLVDHSGGPTLDVKQHSAMTDRYGFVDGLADLAKITEEKRAKLKEGGAFILAIAGGGTRTIFEDATFDVKDNKARLQMENGQVFQFEMKDNQIFLRKDGQLLPLSDQQLANLVKAENGKFKIGNLVIDPQQLSMETDNAQPRACNKDKKDKAKEEEKPPVDTSPSQFRFDFKNWTSRIVDPDGKKIEAKVNPDNSSTITDGNTTISNNNQDSTISVTTTPPASDSNEQPKPETIKIDLDKLTVDTPTLIDAPDKTTIKETNTVIDEDRTVRFDDGPTVNPDGSVRVDKDTYVDKDMTVHSGDWSSSVASQNSNVTEAVAQNVAANVSNKANSIYGLAMAGKIRWAEVASLNSSLVAVLSLMSGIPSDSPAYSMLLNSYKLLVEAINIATPKAQLAESAIQMGLKDPVSIKSVQQGANPEQIKARDLAA